jgi:hypothetical protein
MHGPINVKSPNNTSKWQMEFNSAFKGLKQIWLQKGKREREEVATGLKVIGLYNTDIANKMN